MSMYASNIHSSPVAIIIKEEQQPKLTSQIALINQIALTEQLLRSSFLLEHLDDLHVGRFG
jgi:hypothetical protein